jgi:hypothetical protein
MADKGLKSNVVGLFGGTMLGISSVAPAYGTGASIGGVGLVLGLGLILVGLIFMAILRVRQPAFFRGETIIHESAHATRSHERLVS